MTGPYQTIEKPVAGTQPATGLFLFNPDERENADDSTPKPETPERQISYWPMHRVRRFTTKAEKRQAELPRILPPVQFIRPDLAAYSGSRQMPEIDSMIAVHRQAEKVA